MRLRTHWWWFRLAVLAFATAGLGFYLLHSTPWRKKLGLLPDYKTEIAEGDRVVGAIYAFRARTGLWPEYLEDVRLGGLKFPWFYELQRPRPAERTPALSTAAPAEGLHAHLGYTFGADAQTSGWHLFTMSEDRPERAGPPAGLKVDAAPAAPLEATLVELDRRIAGEPRLIEHRQDKISLLVLASHRDEANAAIAAAINELPQAVWPRLARVELARIADHATTIGAPATGATAPAPAPTAPAASAPAGALPHASQDFVDWATAHPTFSRLYAASWHLRQFGDAARAATLADQALQQPIEVDADDTQTAAFYLYDLARWSYQRHDWPEVIAICSAWGKALDDKRVKDQSCFALRSAAEAAQGNAAAGKADLEKATHADTAWIGANSDWVQQLRKGSSDPAAAARLLFPPYPGEFALFVRPE